MDDLHTIVIPPHFISGTDQIYYFILHHMSRRVGRKWRPEDHSNGYPHSVYRLVAQTLHIEQLSSLSFRLACSEVKVNLRQQLRWKLFQYSRYSDRLRAERPRCRNSSPGMGKIFLFPASSKPALGPTRPSIQWVPWAPYPGIKRPGREADHSPPASAEVNNTWICASTHPYAFMLCA
jgi:hypothetical protein